MFEVHKNVTGGQGDGVELGRVPAVEQDAAAAGVLHDGVDAVADLVDGLVQQHFLAAFVGHGGDDAEAALLGVGQLGGGVPVQQLVGRPLPPLDAVHRAEVVRAFAVRVGQPVGVLIGILVPDLAAQRAEVGGAAGRPEEAAQLADHRLECEFLGGDGGESLGQVEAHHRARDADGADAGAVVRPASGVEYGAYEVEVLFHGAVILTEVRERLPGRASRPGRARRRNAAPRAIRPASASWAGRIGSRMRVGRYTDCKT